MNITSYMYEVGDFANRPSTFLSFALKEKGKRKWGPIYLRVFLLAPLPEPMETSKENINKKYKKTKYQKQWIKWNKSNTIDRSIKLRPLRIDQSQRNEGPTCVRVSWRPRQNCAERHSRAPRVLAHTCVMGGAYWIGLWSKKVPYCIGFILEACKMRL